MIVIAAAPILVAGWLLRPKLGGAEDVQPRSEQDAVVQRWWDARTPGGRISRCVDTGERDDLFGSDIWACRLRYVGALRSVTVCVSMDEHDVDRRLRGVRVGRAGVLCA